MAERHPERFCEGPVVVDDQDGDAGFVGTHPSEA
jgi:hypothetical protein